jgi:NAD(P)-dependent dehydrogenase (short-subunit alcohol dehydrogenase family)
MLAWALLTGRSFAPLLAIGVSAVEIRIVVTRLAWFWAAPEWTIWTTKEFVNKLFVLACFCFMLPFPGSIAAAAAGAPAQHPEAGSCPGGQPIDTLPARPLNAGKTSHQSRGEAAIEDTLFSIRGLRVVVTAGASGIGRAIVDTFAARGARVYVCDIEESFLAELAASSPGIGATLADVGDPRQVDRLFDEALARLGGLDALINNAGIAGPTAAVEDVSPADWDRTIAVNLSGQFYCVRRAVPALKAAGGGAIVNISSTSGRTGLPLRVAYAVSKHAVIGLTETLARELGPAGIRVNTILPGWVDNERNRKIVVAKSAALGITPAAYLEQGLRYVSMRTMIDPLEIAHAALFLCSPAGRHVSGQALGVCGNVEYES